MSRDRLVEPVLDRPGVGRGQEIKVLAAGVEDRLAGLGQAVGQGVGLVLVAGNRARSSGSRRCWSACRPATSSRATSLSLRVLDRAVDRLGGDPLDRAGGQVDPVERPGVVDEGDLLAVGRPDRPLVEAGPLEGIDPALALAVLGADDAARIRPRRRRNRRSTCRRATRPASARGRRASGSGCAGLPSWPER